MIIFRTQPQDIIGRITESVTFECTYDSPSYAIWRINSKNYVYSSILPRNHRVDSSGSFLTVYDVDFSMNGNTYQCIVNSCYSTIGHLYVVPGTYITCIHNASHLGRKPTGLGKYIIIKFIMILIIDISFVPYCTKA